MKSSAVHTRLIFNFILTPIVILLGSDAQGAVVYTQSFNGLVSSTQTDITPAGFTEFNANGSGSANYSLSPTSLQFSGTTSNGAANASAAISIAGINGNSFSISTEFSLDSLTTPSGSTVNFGFGLFGDTPNFSSTSGSYFRVLFTPFDASTASNHLSIARYVNGTSTNANSSLGTISSFAGMTGTLTVSGAYSGSLLSLTATLTSGSNSINVDLNSQELAGTYFGYRTAINAPISSATAEAVTYDNFSISAVPEPTTWFAWSVFAVAGIVWRRWR